MAGIVIACLQSDHERVAVLNGSRGRNVRLCEDVAGALTALTASVIVGLIVEVHPALSADLDALIIAARALSIPPPIVVRLAVRASAMDRFLCSPQLRSGHVSLIGFDSLEADMARLFSPTPDNSARSVILSRVIPSVDASIADAIVVAVIIGGYHVTVRDFARYCNISPRRLSERLAQADAPGAKQLLMWSLLLHTQWRVSCLGWAAKRAAHVAGFRSSEVLSRRIERTTGQRLGPICRTDSFAATLDEFSERLPIARGAGAHRTNREVHCEEVR